MTVVAFIRPEPSPAASPEQPGAAEHRLRRYGRSMRLCFFAVLAAYLTLQAGCLLSLFLHFQSGIVAGTIDGTLAFKFSPLLDDVLPNHAATAAFVPEAFATPIAVGYALLLAIASVPFCAALFYLARLFGLYSHGDIFTPRNTATMQRVGHSVLATGYSPLLLGPFAHALGVLRPVTGITGGMIAFVVAGLILLAISHVMEIGQRIRQDQEDIL